MIEFSMLCLKRLGLKHNIENISLSQCKFDLRKRYEILYKSTGTKNFNDCVYKITTMELELAKINAEKEIALAQAEAAKAKKEFAKLERLNTIANANSNKFTKNMTNLLLGLLVLGEINQASQQATNFRRTFTCTPTGFASGLQYSVNCY